MGSYKTKEDDVHKICSSVFITNFPKSCPAKELFQSCKQYGHVVDTFIPNKRSKTGRRFGFVRFINVFNEERLVNNLYNMSNGSWFSQLKQASMKFNIEGRIAWVEVEGIPCKLWSDNTFKRIATKWGELLDIDDQDEMYFHSKRLCIYTKSKKYIFEEFKIIIHDRAFWIRTKEAPGWVRDFIEENDDEEQNDDGGLNVHESGSYGGDSDVEGVLETIFEESRHKENNLDEEHTNKQENHSGDPFSIYKLLKKKTDNVEKEYNLKHSMKYPLSFTPKKGTDVVGMHAEESRSNNIVNLSDHNAKEVGQVMGYKMDGCLAQKAKKDWVKELCVQNKVNFLALQETKMGNMELFSVKMCWGNFAFDYVHSDSLGNLGGILCVWDPNSFRKSNATVSDYFIMIRGVWRQTGNDHLIIAVYAPHDLKDKQMM
nr:hydroxycinnamoyl-CoA quinate/shikimate transferase [Tanacetum cinerariifolium]